MNFEHASVWQTTVSPLKCVRLRHKDTAPHNRNQCSFIRDRPLGTLACKRRGQKRPGSRENPSAAVWVCVRVRSRGIKQAWGCYCEIHLDTHSPQPLFSNAGKNISETIEKQNKETKRVWKRKKWKTKSTMNHTKQKKRWKCFEITQTDTLNKYSSSHNLNSPKIGIMLCKTHTFSF